MADDYKAIQAKLDAGEELTEKELKDVASMPVDLDAGGNYSDSDYDPDAKPDEEETPDAEPKKGDVAPEDENPDDKSDAPKDKKEEGEPEGEDEDPEKDPKKEPEKEPEEDPGKKDSLDMKKINEELAKPDGDEDLTGYNQREVGLFYEMRKQRRRAQTAEEERDVFKFRDIQRQQAEKQTEEKKEEEEDPFKDREDDDILSVKDAKTLMAKMKSTQPDPADAQAASQVYFQPYIKACEREAKAKYEDFDAVIEVAGVLIKNNEDYQKQIAKSMGEGGNVAVTMYHLAKNDPAYDSEIAKIQARTPQKKPGTSPEEKIKKNLKKPNTSSSHGGGGVPDAMPTLEQFVKMSDEDFAKVPKAEREKMLLKYG